MYFDGSDCDNDRLQGLLDFLAIDGNGDGPESKWAIVMISQSGETLETLASFGLFYSRLKTAVGEHRVAEYIVPVTNERFLIPEGVSQPLTALSAAGILPAAILGIDVVKLLESAAAMNTHFRTAPMGRNVVMDYVAVNHLLENANGGSSWELAVWSRSLVSAGGWYKQLLTTSLGTHRENPPTRVINNLILKSWRRDHLVIEKSNWDHDRLNSMAGKTWPQINEAAVRGTSQALVEAGQPTMNLFMHAADEEGLGQLFQMMMLAMFLHRRLLGG